MAFQRHMNIFFFFLLFSCFLFSSQASKFYVGGRDGWVLHPSENYTNWAQKNRFQINDTLVFKYKKGSDSVLLVNKDDYYNCNTKNPIKKLEEGDSEYKLDKSGPSFFISGKEQNCEKGQKLIVTVLSVKHSNTSHQNPPPKTPTAPTQAPTPSSSHTPKVPPPLAPNSLAPSSSSPGPSIAASPISQGPVTTSPSFSPSSSSPVISPVISSAPSASPGPAPYSYGPAPEAPSPESNAPTEAPTYSPAYSSPPQPETTVPDSPSSSPSPSPSESHPQSLSPGPGTPNAPPPVQSSVWAVTPTYVSVLAGSVTILLSVSLGPVF
ncbi:hypothetical protein SO802_015028 [Lithocarpus litseifolius]|uniref:Phytocyanin domain-containing protein n=1 Tax=Lithocarpus litseifolius TaxID=425828 RepID=A0AAW2CUV0_9ROSI